MGAKIQYAKTWHPAGIAGRWTSRHFSAMAARYKFRLGNAQSITLRCDRHYGDLLACRVRGRLGSVHWATQVHADETRIQSFLDAVTRLVADLSGTAELELQGGDGGQITIKVAVDPRGLIVTDYAVAGMSGGLRRTPWKAIDSYACHHQHYFVRYGPGASMAG